MDPVRVCVGHRYERTAGELLEVVYEYRTKLNKDGRPGLYVRGLSQRAFNSRSTIPLLDVLGDPIDGALWADSPFLSPMCQHVRDNH